MTNEQMQKVAAMKNMRLTGKLELPDNLNPIYIHQGTASMILGLIAKGEINGKELAKNELKARGCNYDGVWIGFDAASKLK